MEARARLRLIASVVSAATAGVTAAVVAPLPDGWAVTLRSLLPILAAAGLAQWLLTPLFARRPGRIGLAQDAGLMLFVIALAGGLAGTLLLPGAGVLLGPLLALMLPLQSPLAALIYGMGALLIVRLLRRHAPEHVAE
jgi:hypothetical protein